MAKHHLDPKAALSTVDPVWTRIRDEAEEIVQREPELATFIYST
ncbi:MAG: serine O-acetyltransferase, partial [Afipia sp.]|nr:serine O-acetyltransferase [Afipia sp.]